MYLSKPEVFSVPIKYINFDILGIEKNDGLEIKKQWREKQDLEKLI